MKAEKEMGPPAQPDRAAIAKAHRLAHHADRRAADQPDSPFDKLSVKRSLPTELGLCGPRWRWQISTQLLDAGHDSEVKPATLWPISTPFPAGQQPRHSMPRPVTRRSGIPARGGADHATNTTNAAACP
jgi:hypothetical protein